MNLADVAIAYRTRGFMQPFDRTKVVDIDLQNLVKFLIGNGLRVARPVSVEERPRRIVPRVLQRRLQLRRGRQVLRRRLLHAEVRRPRRAHGLHRCGGGGRLFRGRRRRRRPSRRRRLSRGRDPRGAAGRRHLFVVSAGAAVRSAESAEELKPHFGLNQAVVKSRISDYTVREIEIDITDQTSDETSIKLERGGGLILTRPRRRGNCPQVS